MMSRFDPSFLISRLDLSLPLIGVYDAPDPDPFRPLVEPAEGRQACVFMFFESWLRGERLLLTARRFGCGGASGYLFDAPTRTEDEQARFLVDREGLKASRELIGGQPGYRPRHPHVVIGPLVAGQEAFLRSVTFLVNADQLTALVWGAHWAHAPREGALVSAPFAAGCGLLAALLGDLDAPRAVIGATDLAMRRHLPADVLAFTTTIPMLAELCALDERSFLARSFIEELRRTRGGTLDRTAR